MVTLPNSETLINEITVALRDAKIPVPPKIRPVKKVKEIVFNKKTSVFRRFVEDTQPELVKMLQSDNKYSKIKRMIKDESEFRDVQVLILD